MFFGGNYESVEDAPWFNPALCESANFHGVWPMQIDGLGPVQIQRELVEGICDGGHSTRHRDTTRTITVEAVLVACDHAAARYGLDWLTCQLRKAQRTRGLDLTFLSASPQDSCADPERLVRSLMDVVLLQEPRITEPGRGYGGRQHQQGNVWRVEWVWGTGNPYSYGVPFTFPIVWDSDQPNALAWSTSCTLSGACPEHSNTVFDPFCPPASIPDPAPAAAGCTATGAGCTPLCAGRRRMWRFAPNSEVIAGTYPSIAETYPALAGVYPAVPSGTGVGVALPGGYAGAGLCGNCGDIAVDIQISNPSTLTPVTGVNLSWVPCGGDVECDRLGEVTITYLGPKETIVLDGVNGRPMIATADGKVLNAAPLVRGGNGAPWTAPVLHCDGCWDLVLDSDDQVDVTVIARSRNN